MTRMKKLFGILLALVLMVTAMTASAATVANSTNHSYDAYQVFTGTQAENGGIALGDVEWGTGVNGDALLTTLKADYDYFDTCATAADVAAVLAETADKSDEAKAFANAAAKNLTSTVTASIAAGATSVNLPAGYYLLVDTTDIGTAHDARNTALLQVTNKDDIKIEKKYNVPTVDKAIVENNSDVEATDKNIGDTIDFKLTGTLPSNYADYETYKYVFHDTLSDGLSLVATYDAEDTTKVVSGVTVMINGENVTDSFVITKNGNALEISCADLKKIDKVTVTADTTVVVTYSAKLNENAVIGSTGNPNTVKLEYSNDPNWDGTGDKEPTGNTPPDEVLVFTYELDVTKVDGANNETKLSGAEFVLYRGEGEAIEYVIVDEDGKVTDWTSDKDKAYKLISDENGFFKVIGLDTGIYHLEETKAPAGYNLLKDPIEIEITATIATDDTTGKTAVDTLKIKVDGSEKDGTPATGVVEATVINNSGATLPETGGIGTTILYVAGGLLIAAALVVLLAKRRTAA